MQLKYVQSSEAANSILKIDVIPSAKNNEIHQKSVAIKPLVWGYMKIRL